MKLAESSKNIKTLFDSVLSYLSNAITTELSETDLFELYPEIIHISNMNVEKQATEIKQKSMALFNKIIKKQNKIEVNLPSINKFDQLLPDIILRFWVNVESISTSKLVQYENVKKVIPDEFNIQEFDERITVITYLVINAIQKKNLDLIINLSVDLFDSMVSIRDFPTYLQICEKLITTKINQPAFKLINLFMYVSIIKSRKYMTKQCIKSIEKDIELKDAHFTKVIKLPLLQCKETDSDCIAYENPEYLKYQLLFLKYADIDYLEYVRIDTYLFTLTSTKTLAWRVIKSNSTVLLDYFFKNLTESQDIERFIIDFIDNLAEIAKDKDISQTILNILSNSNSCFEKINNFLLRGYYSILLNILLKYDLVSLAELVLSKLDKNIKLYMLREKNYALVANAFVCRDIQFVKLLTKELTPIEHNEILLSNSVITSFLFSKLSFINYWNILDKDEQTEFLTLEKLFSVLDNSANGLPRERLFERIYDIIEFIEINNLIYKISFFESFVAKAAFILKNKVCVYYIDSYIKTIRCLIVNSTNATQIINHLCDLDFLNKIFEQVGIMQSYNTDKEGFFGSRVSYQEACCKLFKFIFEYLNEEKKFFIVVYIKEQVTDPSLKKSLLCIFNNECQNNDNLQQNTFEL